LTALRAGSVGPGFLVLGFACSRVRGFAGELGGFGVVAGAGEWGLLAQFPAPLKDKAPAGPESRALAGVKPRALAGVKDRDHAGLDDRALGA
jgi:hypothetical protein